MASSKGLDKQEGNAMPAQRSRAGDMPTSGSTTRLNPGPGGGRVKFSREAAPGGKSLGNANGLSKRFGSGGAAE